MDPSVEKILKLPTLHKAIILAVVVLVEFGALFYFLYLPRYKEHNGLKVELAKLHTDVAEKTRKADNLPKIQKQYNDLQTELKKAIEELPNSKEIPTLLTSITDLGKKAGLDFLVFRPKPEAVKDFYAEVPVDIVISGSYYSVANFFAAVANLPRIVNIANVDFSEVKNVNNRMMTKVTCTATTFRFLAKEEIKNDKKPPKK